jgi:phospholipid-binding lipoprotein MlaA
MSILVAGCSTKPDTQGGQVYDPLEGVNRTMWTLNYDYIDPYVLRPTAVAYVTYVPTPVRHGLSNFFSNLGEPASVLNNLLMGNGHKAATHFNRFWLNSTFGLLGIMDIASGVGLVEDDSKGLDDTLGHYGVGNGAYVMVPAAGPYTVRNVAGFVDSNYFPMTYLNVWGTVGKFLVQGLEARAGLINQESILENSPDPYAFTRDIYLQRQAYKAEVVIEQYHTIEENEFDDYLEQYGYEE